jgi:PAS domain S-box-containing protein
MKDNEKTKERLVHELSDLRSQIAELKKSITGSTSAQVVAEEALRYSESIVETIRQPLLVLDADLKIISANRNFYRTFKVTPGETIGSFIFDLGNKQWDIPELRELLQEVLPAKQVFDDFEVDHNFQDIGHKIMLLNAREIYRKDIGAKMILLAIEDITERKRLEDLLTDSEERFRRLFETASDGIVLLEKREGKIIHANPATEMMLGYTKKESIGNKLQDIGVFLNMGDFQTTMQTLNKIGIINYEDVPVKTKSGKHIYTDIYIVDRAKLVQCNIRDTTERKRADLEIHESEERFRAIFERSTVGKSLTAPDGKLLRINKAFADMLGYTIEELSQFNFAEITHPDDVAKSQECIRILLAGEQISDRFEKRYIHKSGNIVWVDISTTLLRNEQGTPLHLVTSIVDITERKQAEEALKREEEESRRSAKEKETIAKMGRIISSNINVNEVYERFAEEVGKVISFDRISVNIINRAEGEVTVAYAAGLPIPGRQPGDVFSLTGSTNELVAAKKSGLHIQPKIEEEMDGLLSEQRPSFKAGLRSQMAVPLISEGQVIGILNFLSKQQNAYTDAVLRLGEEIGLQIAGAIANAQLYGARLRVEKQLQDTLDSLRKAVGATIQVMVSAVETRDPYTSGHQIRSADLARAIATEMGLPPAKIEGIRMAGSIHDIGKLSIPAEILSKPTKLSEIEFSLIKEHANRGYEILKDVESPWPLAEIVYQHHERIDGSGYPRNLKGEEILIEARILTVADVVEAMASHRPYRAGLGIDAALKEIEKNRGIIYDKSVADACMRLFREKGFKLEMIDYEQ